MELVYLPLELRELSHELSTPLTGILGSAHLLEDESLTPEQKNFVKDIIEEGNKLVKLRDLLLNAKSLVVNPEISHLQPGNE